MEKAEKAVSKPRFTHTACLRFLNPVTPQSKLSKTCRAFTLFESAGSLSNARDADTPIVASSNLKFWLAVSASALPCDLPPGMSKEVVEEGAVALLCTKLTWCAARNAKMHLRVRVSMFVIEG